MKINIIWYVLTLIQNIKLNSITKEKEFMKLLSVIIKNNNTITF